LRISPSERGRFWTLGRGTFREESGYYQRSDGLPHQRASRVQVSALCQASAREKRTKKRHAVIGAPGKVVARCSGAPRRKGSKSLFPLTLLRDRFLRIRQSPTPQIVADSARFLTYFFRAFGTTIQPSKRTSPRGAPPSPGNAGGP